MNLSENGEGGIWVFDEVDLPDGWVFDQLGNRCTVRRGASPRPAGAPRYFGGGTIPWIKIGDATNTGSRFIEKTAEHVNKEGAKCSVHIPAGSLIIANSGVSLGFAAITRVSGCIHDGWLLTTEFQELDRDYLYYCINVATQRLRQLADGTTQPNLNTGIARRLMLPLPPLSEQRAIASVLGALDDKIEVNRRMNATLEAMARALFQSWFVDFDPVRAKSEGRQPDGMDAQTAALFPAEFEDSELGMIPKGWRVESLAEMMEIQGGTQPPASEFLSELAPGYVRLVQIRDYESDSHLTFVRDTSKLRKCSIDDVMIARYGASVARICWGLEGAYNVALVKVVPQKPFYREYLRSYLQTYEFKARLIGMSNRSVQAGFNKGDIASFQIAIPSNALLEVYQAMAWKLRNRALHNKKQSRTLAALRDTLLPKLLSGELRVNDALQTLASAL